MTSTKTWIPTALCVAMAMACTTDQGKADSGDTSADTTSATESSSQTGETTETGETGETSGTAETSETGEPASCDPSDSDIGPAVEVVILNQTGAALYFTEATQCEFGTPFGINHGGVALAWLYGICDSCADALQGNCMCPSACVEDSVIRIDPGGRYTGSWSGGRRFGATLTPECTDGFCNQCYAIAQAEPGDYLASAIASPMVLCTNEPCDCLGTPDPDGWCRIYGTRAGGDLTGELAFVYPDETALEISFE